MKIATDAMGGDYTPEEIIPKSFKNWGNPPTASSVSLFLRH